ncbi:MAG: hypothetical protein ACPG5T_02400 [Endozoicomonas sp.]
MQGSKGVISWFFGLCLVYTQSLMGHSSAINLTSQEGEETLTSSSPLVMTTIFPMNFSSEDGCGVGKGVLSGFVCSQIGDPENVTVIDKSSPDFEKIRESLYGNESSSGTPSDNYRHVAAQTTGIGYDQWVTSIAIWTWEGIEMFILIGGYKGQLGSEVTYKKNQILSVAAVTSVVTQAGIYGVGAWLAETGREIPEPWIELIEGLTKLKASTCVGGWALALAGGTTGKQELAMAGLLTNIVSNTFRETAEGALVTLPLILDKQYAAISLSLIPLVILGLHIKDFKLGINNPYLRMATWGVLATLGAGLFSGSWHEFEEVAGESAEVWDIGKNVTVWDNYKILSHKQLPMAVIAPFGYRPNPTIISLSSGLIYFSVVSIASIFRWVQGRRSGQMSTSF